MIRRRLLAALAGAAIVAVPFVATAHPRGQRPVLIVVRTGTGLDGSWIVAVDDMAALGTHLGLGVRSPDTYAGEPRFIDYLADRLKVTGDGTPCSVEPLAVARAATGWATALEVTCGRAPDEVTLTSTLLLDLSRDYRTPYQVTTETGVARGILTDTQPSVRIVFNAPVVGDPTDDDSAGRLERFARGEGGTGLIIAFGLAAVLGMVHGATPGHGKTLAVAAMISSRGTLRNAAFLAGIVAVAHGVSTLVLAILASQLDAFLPNRIVPWLEGATALLAAVVGVSLLRGRAAPFAHRHPHEHGDHEVGDGHDAEVERPPPRSSTRQLVAVGIIGGLIPGPEAFAVGFLAIAVDRIVIALLLIGAFSLGLAAIVFLVAALAGSVARFVPATRLVPRIGGVVFLVVAVALAAHAITRG